ncbi:hypothetical protein [Sagittula sp. SSi028]|uniref:hypothetical protein n=1 Tax=Sagittula sp. SSi028 TaxID=3400636 RepID=UPI003AF8A203
MQNPTVMPVNWPVEPLPASAEMEVVFNTQGAPVLAVMPPIHWPDTPQPPRDLTPRALPFRQD